MKIKSLIIGLTFALVITLITIIWSAMLPNQILANTTFMDATETKLVAGDTTAEDHLGWSVAISGETVVIGAPYDNDDAGSAYVFTRSGSIWTQEAKLTASDAAVEDQFSRSVAISGETVVIGAPYDDDAGINSGSVYIYQAVLSEEYEAGYNDGYAIGSDEGYQAGYDDGYEAAIGKLDVEFILQAPTKDFVSYHLGVSYGGVPIPISVESVIESAFGAYYSADTGSTWVEITDSIGTWSMGEGHLRLLVDLPDVDDYWIYQFVLEAEVDGHLVFGTIHVENDNFKHWPKP